MAEPGDLIEIQRKLFKHWALYVGDGDVIHLTGDGVSSIFGIFASIGIATVIAIVKKEKLKDVASGDTWMVKNQLDKKYKTKSPDVIMKEAEQQVGKKIQYDLFNLNCEHFVTNLRYGKPECRQVQDVVFGGALLGSLASGATLASRIS